MLFLILRLSSFFSESDLVKKIDVLFSLGVFFWIILETARVSLITLAFCNSVFRVSDDFGIVVCTFAFHIPFADAPERVFSSILFLSSKWDYLILCYTCL